MLRRTISIGILVVLELAVLAVFGLVGGAPKGHVVEALARAVGIAAAIGGMAFFLVDGVDIVRVWRMLRVELMKLFAHPFFYTSLFIVLLATALAALAASSGTGGFRRPQAMEMFATGAKWGLKLSAYVLVIFGGMLFAGEFDKGTIKVLLTRPLTRTDLFAAKCAAGLLLGGVLVATVLALAWSVGCWVGEIGPAWDSETYYASFSEADLNGHLWIALKLALISAVAPCFLGLFISNLMESSGYAVAAALILFISADTATTFVGSWAPYWPAYYSSYAFETLRSFAQGSSMAWKDHRGLPWQVPLAMMASCTAAGYVIFRWRNITV